MYSGFLQCEAVSVVMAAVCADLEQRCRAAALGLSCGHSRGCQLGVRVRCIPDVHRRPTGTSGV